MRIIKYNLAIVLVLGGLVLIVSQAFLYSSNTTHPYLTEQIVKFYNYYYDPDITLEQLEKMKEGSTHEDFGDRSVWYHFYDPIYNVGTGGLTAKQWAQNPQKQSTVPGGDHSWQTVISDYNVGYKQKAFYSLGHILHLIEDMAVPAHTRNDAHYNGGDPLENWAGDLPKDSNFYNIASPLISKGIKPKIFNNLDAYFDEVANFSNRNFFSKDSIDDTIDENGKVKPDAKYSGPKIVKEVFNTRYIGYAYGKVDDYSRLIRLLKIEKNDRGKKTYSLDDSPEIHADYFSILSKEAVINGAGVIKLFFDSTTEPAQEFTEPEKELSFWQKIGNSIVGGVKFIISVVDGLIHTPPQAIDSVVEESIPELEYMGTIGTFAPEVIDKVLGETESAEEPIINEPEIGTEESYEPKPPKVEENIFLVKKVIDGDTIILENGQEVRYIGIDAPEVPNGCFARETTDKNRELIEGKQVKLEKDISEIDSYGRLLRYVYLDSLFINDYLVRNGYAYDFAYEPDIKYKERFAEAEKDAKENRRGLWGDVCHPVIIQGPKTGGSGGISGKLVEEIQNQSQSQNQGSSESQESEEYQEEQEEQEESELPDTTPPDILVSPLVFNYASSSLVVQWSSSEFPSISFDAEYKEGEDEWQSLLENTNETQAIFVVINKDVTYYFRVRGRDLLQNQSAWQETSIEILSKPVVINEIAWMGTTGSPQDEWIELFNRANYDVDLTGWSLKSNDSSPEIIFVDGDTENKTTVNNIILAKGYYLLERTNDDTTSELADWYGSFGSGGLNNSGEILELRDNSNNLIDLVDSPSGGTSWYAGNNEEKRTMERIDPDKTGTNSKNWKTYIGSGSTVTDIGGNPIFGTPKAKNSVYKLYTAVDKNITEDTAWILEDSPYLIYADGGGSNELLEITQGVTLTIEAGVIVKFVNPGLKVYGTIKAGGTSEKPIVFTNYNDNKYGGDIFGEEDDSIFCQENPDDSKCPQPGAWSGVWFIDSSINSVLDNIIIRYAGSRVRPFRTGSVYSFPGSAVGAGIRVDNTSIVFKNSIIEHNLFAGILLTNSPDTIIENSIFQNHLKYDYESQWKDNYLRNIAVYIDSSSPQIKNSTFQDNITGIYMITNSQPIIENNQFTNNSYPIWVQASFPNFLGNQIDNNYWNGIVLKNLKLNQNYFLGGGSVFINYQENPSDSIVVPVGYILTIEPGTIIKSVYGTSGFTIEGTLIAEGTSEKRIVFTSIYDDEYGGDTNGDANASQPVAGSWGQIVFSPTSINSSLNYVVIRYGGNKWMQAPIHQKEDYVLKVESCNITLANAVIEKNTAGLYLENSSSQITNTIFQNHRWSQPFNYFISTGIWLVSSNPTIDISTFFNNILGIYIDAASLPILTDPVFNENDKDIEDLRSEEGT